MFEKNLQRILIILSIIVGLVVGFHYDRATKQKCEAQGGTMTRAFFIKTFFVWTCTKPSHR
jgi:hypothetical protein